MSDYTPVFEMSMPIRWGDMDAFGHVNNTVYFRYMEQARISWFEQLGIAGGNGGPVDVAVALDERLERHRAEVVGANIFQCAAVAADGGADRVTQESFGHQCLREIETNAPIAMIARMRLNVLYTNIGSNIERFEAS